MALFKKTNDEKKTEGCCCGGACNAQDIAKANESIKNGFTVKVLGSGCKKCNELEANTVEALKQLGMDTAIEHVSDFAQIAAYGVMTTPALVINGKVISYGKVLKTDEIISLINKAKE